MLCNQDDSLPHKAVRCHLFLCSTCGCALGGEGSILFFKPRPGNFDTSFLVIGCGSWSFVLLPYALKPVFPSQPYLGMSFHPLFIVISQSFKHISVTFDFMMGLVSQLKAK